MRRLILFRHAKAEPRGPGQDDFDRPLARRGWEDAAIVGRALARDGFAPDMALVSSARRTNETWIGAQDCFPSAKTELAREIYDATPEAIREAIDGAADRCDTLIVIGHNPGLHEVAIELLIVHGMQLTTKDWWRCAPPSRRMTGLTVPRIASGRRACGASGWRSGV